MAHKRITPVQALFSPDGRLIVIDDNGIVWRAKNQHTDWERYCILPDVPVDEKAEKPGLRILDV